jgi:plastocyanin
MRRGVLIVAVLSLGVVPLLAGCGSSSSSSKSTTGSTGSSGSGGQKTIAGVMANDHGKKTASSSGKTEVELDDYYFEPTVIQGTAGQKVKLELKNEGKVDHSFTVDSEKIDKTISPGGEAEVTVTIPKSGVVSFYCKFHKSSGMAGALAVTGASVSGGSGGMTGTNNGTTTGSYKSY